MTKTPSQPAALSDEDSERTPWERWAPLAVWLLPLLLFAPALAFPLLAWDDHTFILRNNVVTGDPTLVERLLTPQSGYIIPVTTNLQSLLWALSPSAWLFHACNVLLHAGVCGVLYALCRRLGASALGAGAAALVFGVHPVVVEPVAWATGLKDLLAVGAGLGATLLFVTGVQSGSQESAPPSGKLWAGAAVLALVAMFSKPVGATVGLAWLAWLGLCHRDASKAAWAAAASVFVAGLAVLLGSSAVHQALLDTQPNPEVAPTGGRLWQPLMAAGYHLEHLLWPVGLHPSYPIDRTVGWGDWHTLLGAAGVLGVGVLAWMGRKRPEVVLGLALAAVLFAPVSNLIPFPRFLADSYMYGPLAGVALAASGVVSWAPAKRAAAVAVLAVVVLGAVSVSQVQRWSSHEALWVPVTTAHPDWHRPWQALGQGLMAEQRPKEAAEAYRQSFARHYDPGHLSTLARALAISQQPAEAECVFAEDLRLGPKPERAGVNLALFLVTHPQHTPAHPWEGRQALEMALSVSKQGELRWKPQWIEALEPRLALLSNAKQGPWSPRVCPSLQARAEKLVPGDALTP